MKNNIYPWALTKEEYLAKLYKKSIFPQKIEYEHYHQYYRVYFNFCCGVGYKTLLQIASIFDHTEEIDICYDEGGRYYTTLGSYSSEDILLLKVYPKGYKNNGCI